MINVIFFISNQYLCGKYNLNTRIINTCNTALYIIYSIKIEYKRVRINYSTTINCSRLYLQGHKDLAGWNTLFKLKHKKS